MSEITKNILQEWTEEFLQGSDKFIVEIQIKPTDKIFVFIDSDTGVTIDDCINLSRFLEKNLQEITDMFELNVSSAGIDKPLKHIRQYRKNIGKDVEVVCKNEPSKKIIGTLTNVSEDFIEIKETKKIKKEIQEINHKIEFQNIKTTKLVIKF